MGGKDLMWHLLGNSIAVQKPNRLFFEVHLWDLELARLPSFVDKPTGSKEVHNFCDEAITSTQLAKLVQTELTVSIRHTLL